MPAAAIAIPAAISVGTSIWGASKKAKASKEAARIQKEEAERQSQGFRDTLHEYNPRIGERADQAAEEARAAAGQGSDLVMGMGREAQEGLRPYTTLGSEGAGYLRDFMAPGGAGSKTFTASDMEQYDPGYQFRLDEAKKAMEKSAAARGGLLGGGFAKALAGHQQNLASSEFGAAEARFRAQQKDRFDRLFNVTELGGRAAGQSGQFGMDAGRFAADLGFRGAQTAGQFGTRGTEMMANNALNTQRAVSELMVGGSNAEAAGKVGGANAWGDAFTTIGQAAQGAGEAYLWRNPAVKLPDGYDPGSYRPPDWRTPGGI